jgi:hypothetical protein
MNHLDFIWVDNNKIDLGEVRWGGVAWIDLAQVRVNLGAFVNTLKNSGLREMLGSS